MREVWRTRIYIKGNTNPIDIIQKDVLKEDLNMEAAQDVAHKIFSKKYIHVSEKGKERYIPISQLKEIILDTVKVKEESDG